MRSLTFHEKSCAMQFFIISVKAGVPCAASALLTVLATATTSAGSTATHYSKIKKEKEKINEILSIRIYFNNEGMLR